MNPTPTQDPIADSYARLRKALSRKCLQQRISEFHAQQHNPHYQMAARKLVLPEMSPEEYDKAVAKIARELGI